MTRDQSQSHFYRTMEYINALTMIPGILLGAYKGHMLYLSYPNSWCWVVPMSYASMAYVSYFYHLTNARNICHHLQWFHYDIVAQLSTSLATTYHSYFAVPGAFIIGVFMISVYSLKFFHFTHHRAANCLSAIGILISSGKNPFIWFLWTTWFCCYTIGILYPNRYTHGLFHFGCHHAAWQIWNQLFCYD
jgi:hypothetical protein